MATDDKKDLETRATNTAMAERPAFIEDSAAGTEQIGKADVKIPRLAIAQGLSPQLIPGDPSNIPGLQIGQFFNDLSGEIYGKGPLQFIVVRRDVKRIEFDPNDRKIPIDLNVPAHDPRNDWTKGPDGKGVAPRATKFVEFVVLLLHKDRVPEPIVASIQESNKFNKKTNERLSGFLKMKQPPAPIYSCIYEFTVGMEKNDKGTFGTWTVAQVGFVQDPALYALAKKSYEDWKDKTVDVNRVAEDADTFDPASMEGAGDTSGM